MWDLPEFLIEEKGCHQEQLRHLSAYSNQAHLQRSEGALISPGMTLPTPVSKAPPELFSSLVLGDMEEVLRLSPVKTC